MIVLAPHPVFTGAARLCFVGPKERGVLWFTFRIFVDTISNAEMLELVKRAQPRSDIIASFVSGCETYFASARTADERASADSVLNLDIRAVIVVPP